MAKRKISRWVSVDDDKKQVFCKVDEAPAGATNLVSGLISQGYTLNPRTRRGSGLNADECRKLCKTEEQKEKFNAICSNKEKVEVTKVDKKTGKETKKMSSGFFTARAWLLDELGIKQEESDAKK